MNVAERLRAVRRKQICEVCLTKHGNRRCFSMSQCMVHRCNGNHHSLLHRVEETVQLQKAKSDYSVIFRTIPVTLYVGKRQFDTIAFLDEGSSATLVDETVAARLKAEGTPEPLIVTWTGNISRFESGSRGVEMMISAKGSKERFSLSNTRTVSELQLPEQNVRYTDVVKRYTHLTGVPVKDHSPGLPTILVGLDNLHLFAPLESRVGRSNEPIAVRSKLGWTIYGYGEKRSGVQTRLNLNSVKLVGQTESQYMTLRKPNSSNRQAWVHTNTGKNKQTTAKQTIMEVGDSNPEPEVAFGQSYGPGNVRATLPGCGYAATNVWPIRHADKRQLITDRYGSE
ncbi:uncharacterized protein LOC134215940 [Armigeres subalbatus]|uniref:uncharacterized protein LOC134215940 n=1 Tax=Armigeres subalbatus TaxID=124917 RepID=UPI002ED6B9F7